MRVLVACEFSGVVRREFAAKGHQTLSCDLLPTERLCGPLEEHYQGDIRDVLYAGGWDLMIAHPPCTYLAISGMHWNNRIPGRREKHDEALAFVRLLLEAPIERIALENPVGAISKHIRKPDQYIQPWEHGHPESKKTGLWLKGLPLLQPSDVLVPTQYQTNGKSPRWENQTPTGQNKLGPSKDRAKLRSITYIGIARAMADQWG
jgi:hypothetical protein